MDNDNLSNFNSIKVRLEQCSPIPDTETMSIFQFHKGAIRTGKEDDTTYFLQLFQFHKGAIRTPASPAISTLL